MILYLKIYILVTQKKNLKLSNEDVAEIKKEWKKIMKT